MTTLVMVQQDGDVGLGWDSLATSTDSILLARPKFFTAGSVTIGVAGDLSVAADIQRADLPTYTGGGVYQWLVRQWTPAVRDAIHGQEEWEALLAVTGQAFAMDSDCTVLQTADGVYAAGSGGMYAKAALYAGADILTALRIAANIDPYTGGPLFVTTARVYAEAQWDSPAASGTLEPQPVEGEI